MQSLNPLLLQVVVNIHPTVVEFHRRKMKDADSPGQMQTDTDRVDTRKQAQASVDRERESEGGRTQISQTYMKNHGT